jgi:hyaluronan synthase
MPYGLLFLTVLILGLAGTINYLIAGILTLHYPKGHITKDYSHKPTVSILLPCYNEGSAVYDTVKSIRGSDYPQGKLDIIVTDDCSVDNSYEWILKAEQDFPHVKAIRNPRNLGKTETILNAMNASHADIVMVVDSDTVLAPTCITEVMACFASPKMGVVGVPASVKNPNENALTAYQTAVYFSGFRVYRVWQSHLKGVGCIGGYALAIRRQIFKDIEPELHARRWFGTIVNDGEDRFITHLVLLRGYDTYQDADAKCWTSVPSTYGKYWGQQLRWRRTFLRDFFWTLRTIRAHVCKLHPILIHTYVVLPLALIVAAATVMMVATTGGVGWFDFRRVVSYLFASFLALALAQTAHRDQQVKNPLKLIVYAPWWLVNSFLLTVAATLTLDCGDWGNRNKKVVPAEPAVPLRPEPPIEVAMSEASSAD